MIWLWTGLLRKNLREHEITPARARRLAQQPPLCRACRNVRRDCPVAQVRADPRPCPCYALRTGETESPFTAFYVRLDAEPMLKWLQRAKETLEQKEDGK